MQVAFRLSYCSSKFSLANYGLLVSLQLAGCFSCNTNYTSIFKSLHTIEVIAALIVTVANCILTVSKMPEDQEKVSRTRAAQEWEVIMSDFCALAK